MHFLFVALSTVYLIYEKLRKTPLTKRLVSFEETLSTFLRENPVPAELLSSDGDDDDRWRQVLKDRRMAMLMFVLFLQVDGKGDFHFRIYEELDRCAFFFTESGHFGTAFRAAKEGDLVVLFQGSNRPILVRPVGDEYSLVGPAYVHWMAEDYRWTGDEGLEEFILI
jgi:hypothetical protein